MQEDLKKYLGLFVTEASEHVDQLARGVGHLSDAGAIAARPDLIADLFRHAHSVKGMSAAMSFDEIVELAHAAEQLLGDIQRSRLALSPSLAQKLTEATDRLAGMVEARGRGSTERPVPDLVAALKGRFAEVTQAPVAAPLDAMAPAPGSDELTTLVSDRLRSARVRTELLDAMLESAGELLLGVERVRVLSRELTEPQRQVMEEGIDRLQHRVRELHGQVTQARLTPLSILTEQLPRQVREIARRSGRRVELTVSGAEVEIDRSMVEDLAEVLLHLLRNCVDHGIEPADIRQAAGKPPEGRVTFKAARERDRLLLEVSDDGRGFSPESLRRAAVRSGRLDAATAEALTDEAAIQLACLPGISTAASVTDISGRGGGLDAAKVTIESFGGSFEISSQADKGASFRIGLPLSISLVPVLLAEVAGETVALPISKVQAALALPAEGRPLAFAGRELTVQPLDRLLGFSRDRVATAPIALVVGTGEDLVAVAIDRLVGQQDAVIKPLSRPLDRVPGLAGVTLLGSGQPVFILEVGRLLLRA